MTVLPALAEAEGERDEAVAGVLSLDSLLVDALGGMIDDMMPVWYRIVLPVSYSYPASLPSLVSCPVRMAQACSELRGLPDWVVE